MSRDLTAGMVSGIKAATVTPFVLMEFTTTVTTVRLWTGIGSLVVDGNTYDGAGDLISISPIEENDTLKVAGITVAVSGASIDAIVMSLTELRTGQAGSLKLGLFDGAGAVISSPKTIFRGRLDACAIEEKDPERPLLVLAFENQLIDLKRSREWRYTNNHQQKLYPGDTGFRYVEGLQDKTLTWGWR